MIVALATPRVATSVDEGLAKIEQFISEAAAHGAGIVCFPEAYLPGLRGLDFDVPPFDRAVMDGYAVRRADLAAGAAELTVLEEVTAGAVPRYPLGPGQTTRVMTGAPIPDGADAVVMIERSRMLDDGRVRLEGDPKPDHHVMRG